MSNDSSAKKLYTTLEKEGSATYGEKRSEFIGHAVPIKSEEEALAFVKRIKAENYDARHNVYAYVLSGGSIQRYSDDGEPQGTAGIPVLDVIRKSGIDDACVVVTRYFGGILLGAGGLVRAYTAAAKAAIDVSGIVTYESYTELKLLLSYSDYQKLLAKLPAYGAIVDNTDFQTEVVLSLAVKATDYIRFSEFVRELLNGRVKVCRTGERFDCIK